LNHPTTFRRPWASNKLFEGLNSNQLDLLERYLYPVAYKPHESIMKEGEEGSFVFLAGEGSAYVQKGELKLSDIHPGDLVGLMALIDQQPRSASVIAGKDGVSGYAIDLKHWKQLMNEEHAEVKTAILTNYLKYQQTAFRNTNQLGLKEARARLELEKQRVMSAHFFAQMVVGLISFVFLLGFLTDLAKQIESTFISFVLLFGYAIWSFLFIRHSKIPLRAFGITMDNFQSAIRLIGGATVVFIISLFALKWLLTIMWPEVYGNRIIDFYLLEKQGLGYTLIVLVVYALHAFLQEFIARGCIQGGLMQFVVGKWAQWKAIVLSTLMFSTFHIMIDLRYGFITIIPGLFWGYLFYKQKNLLAIGISHIAIGILALFVLNLMK
jgi:CRP-like cAMP-binding protein